MEIKLWKFELKIGTLDKNVVNVIGKDISKLLAHKKGIFFFYLNYLLRPVALTWWNFQSWKCLQIYFQSKISFFQFGLKRVLDYKIYLPNQSANRWFLSFHHHPLFFLNTIFQFSIPLIFYKMCTFHMQKQLIYDPHVSFPRWKSLNASFYTEGKFLSKSNIWF